MKKKSLQLINEALSEYNKRYNTSFNLLSKYPLFPKERECGYNVSWPGNNHAGVYFVMTKDDEILYVGQSKNIGKRLNDHFPPQNKGLSKICTFKEKWRKDPNYLYVATTPNDAIWERLSLEEFLIQKLNPIDNTQGKND